MEADQKSRQRIWKTLKAFANIQKDSRKREVFFF